MTYKTNWLKYLFLRLSVFLYLRNIFLRKINVTTHVRLFLPTSSITQLIMKGSVLYRVRNSGKNSKYILRTHVPLKKIFVIQYISVLLDISFENILYVLLWDLYSKGNSPLSNKKFSFPCYMRYICSFLYNNFSLYRIETFSISWVIDHILFIYIYIYIYETKQQ